jgi:multiple sugar transport system substrate-binding protein
MLADAQKIRALGPNIYGFYFAGACSGCLTFTVLPNLYADNADLFKGDDLHAQTATVEGNDALAKTLQFYQDVWKQGLAPKGSQSQDGSTWVLPFQKGNIGMSPEPLGGYASASAAERKDIGIAPLPGATGGISTYIGGANFAIPKAAKNAAGAWEFIQFALSKKMQALAPTAGFAPIRTDLVNDAAFAAKYPSVIPGLTAAKTGSAPRTLYHNQLFSLPAGPWLKMFNEAVFKGDVAGAMTAGQTGFQAVLKGNG